MKFDLVIRGGFVATPEGLERRDLGLARGVVRAVADPGDAIDGAEVVDATGKLILPGLVDAHCHIPGFFLSSRLDDFASATSAAAAGGVTTIMLMPTEDPRTISGRYFSLKQRLGEEQSFVDFAIQAVIGPLTDRETVEELADLGAISFELFLAYGGNPGFIVGHDDYELFRLLGLVKSVEGIAGITPHSGSMIARLTDIERRMAASRIHREILEKEIPPTPVESFATTRPGLSEVLGIGRACSVAAEIGTPIHLRALSTERSVVLATRYREWVPVTTEVMSHHLLLSAAEARRMGPYGIIVPPIRPAAVRDRLRVALRDAEIDMVVSDHSPVLREDKELGWRNIWRTAPGMPGFQTLLLTMLHLVDEGVLRVEDIVRTCAELPAKTFGLYPRKGALVPGSDADLVIVDPGSQTLVRDADQLSRAQYTTLKGRVVNAAIDQVYLRGKLVSENQKIVSTPGGRFVRP